MGGPKQVCCIFFQRPDRNIGGAYMGRPSPDIFLFETFFMTYRWHWWVILVNERKTIIIFNGADHIMFLKF